MALVWRERLTSSLISGDAGHWDTVHWCSVTPWHQCCPVKPTPVPQCDTPSITPQTIPCSSTSPIIPIPQIRTSPHQATFPLQARACITHVNNQRWLPWYNCPRGLILAHPLIYEAQWNTRQIGVAEQLVAEKWVAEQWVAEQWVAEHWVAEQWVSEQWVTEQWVAEQCVAVQWVAAQWVTERWVRRAVSCTEVGCRVMR